MYTYYEQIKNIKRDLGQTAAKITKSLAEQARLDLIKSHDYIVTNYYSSHDPSSYHRHGIAGLFYSIIPHNVRSIQHSGFKASVTVSPDDMEEHYHTSSNVVFDLMWNHGVRGLPHHGNRNLPTTNERWVNPYWSGQEAPYHNVFITSIKIGGYNTITGTPHNVLKDVVFNWDKVNGKRLCEELANRIK